MILCLPISEKMTTRWDDLEIELRRRIARRLTARERATVASTSRVFSERSTCPPGPIPESDITTRFRPLSDVVPARWYTPQTRVFSAADLIAIFGPRLLPLTAERLSACAGRTALLVREDCAVKRAADVRRNGMWFRRLEKARGREGALSALADMGIDDPLDTLHRYRDWVRVARIGERRENEETSSSSYWSEEDEVFSEEEEEERISHVCSIEGSDDVLCERDGLAFYSRLDTTFRRVVDPCRLYVFFCDA